MTEHTLSKSDLLQFTGSECLYRHPLVRSIAYTDGARHVAVAGGAFWLLDQLAFAQVVPEVRSEAFQVWTLTVNADRSANLVCDDGNRNVVFTRRIPWTDFPLDEITLYLTDGIILLPSEY